MSKRYKLAKLQILWSKVDKDLTQFGYVSEETKGHFLTLNEIFPNDPTAIQNNLKKYKI